MSDPLEPDSAAGFESEGWVTDEHEHTDGMDALPVLAGPLRIMAGRPTTGAVANERRAVAMIPAVQAAAAAAGGFVAGAAVLGLVHRRQQRSNALSRGRRAGRDLARRGTRRPSRAGELVQIVGSRSLLLDVHLLGGPGADR
jgi:hypothetical protein